MLYCINLTILNAYIFRDIVRETERQRQREREREKEREREREEREREIVWSYSDIQLRLCNSMLMDAFRNY